MSGYNEESTGHIILDEEINSLNYEKFKKLF